MKIFRNALFFLLISFSLVAPAQALLPGIDEDLHGTFTAQECKDWLEVGVYSQEEKIKEYMADQSADDVDLILACGIKSGYIKFWMVPFYIKYALNFLIGLAGIISVLMILVGAYFYIAGGISDDKEKGKTVIKYAIFGLILTSLAWIVVNFILLLITS